MDRGYIDFARLFRFARASAYFEFVLTALGLLVHAEASPR
jgi:hypothetical protein